jgi:hypothetical protein
VTPEALELDRPLPVLVTSPQNQSVQSVMEPR